jgi:folate-binding protein YgfZ
MSCYQANKTAFQFTITPDKLLKGLTSNILTESNNAFLSAKGKIIATCHQVQIDNDNHIVVIDTPSVDGFLAHINKYLPLSPTDMKQLNAKVYYDLSGDVETDNAIATIDMAVGKIIISDQIDCDVDDDTFTTFRLNHFLPIQTIDFNDEMLLNVFPENFVSYTKGCYIGQEVIARVHNLSSPPRKLVVERAQPSNESLTSSQLDKKTNSYNGFCFIDNKQA